MMTAAELTKELFAASARGDMDRVYSLFDDACVIREPDSLPWAGEYIGKDGMREMFAKMTSLFDVTARVVEIFESSPTSIVSVIAMDFRSKRTGRTVSIEVAERTRSRHGLIVEETPFYWDTQLVAAEA